jgi:ABC-type multidrug transport system fused ATPase/permease subunit
MGREPVDRSKGQDQQDANDRTEPPDLWLDRYARGLGFGWLADRVPVDVPPSYLYAVTAVVLWRAVSISYSVANDIPLITETNPYFALQPLALLGAVYGARTLSRSYDRVMDEMRIDQRADEPVRLRRLAGPRVPWVLFAVAAGLQLVRATLDMAAFTETGLVANFVVFPFVYAPILVQFGVVYVGIEFLAPYRLANSGVGVDFLDPHGVGGLRPLGELVKRAYYFVVAGLLVYALITYAPFVPTPDWEVSAAAGTIFTGVWVVSIATVAFAVYTLHRYMRREKRDELQRLEDERREIMDNPWDVRDYEVPDDQRDRLDDIQQRIDRVSATREYPATFSIWTQLLLSVAIPKALQLVLAGL